MPRGNVRGIAKAPADGAGMLENTLYSLRMRIMVLAYWRRKIKDARKDSLKRYEAPMYLLQPATIRFLMRRR
jgi:hypothetical protein